jgi:hypothetical protein
LWEQRRQTHSFGTLGNQNKSVVFDDVPDIDCYQCASLRTLYPPSAHNTLDSRPRRIIAGNPIYVGTWVPVYQETATSESTSRGLSCAYSSTDMNAA